jgi:hypothetical protein
MRSTSGANRLKHFDEHCLWVREELRVRKAIRDGGACLWTAKAAEIPGRGGSMH